VSKAPNPQHSTAQTCMREVMAAASLRLSVVGRTIMVLNAMTSPERVSRE
jgi:hypothetical protein